ncbi:MAG: hypothetical protein HQL53_01255 [Magnetococcales bacterium]|nr:hypothetical protein [Magnetococcales bacterium]
MSSTKRQYSVRLAVEVGKRVVATLEDVGRRGDRSLKKIENASQRATTELRSLDRRLSSGFRAMVLAAGAYISVDLATWAEMARVLSVRPRGEPVEIVSVLESAVVHIN